MATAGKRQIALLFTFCWAVASFGVSIAPFFSDTDDMASASAYHDIRHLLSETQPVSGTERDTMACFDGQWVSLNRTRAWHAMTSLLLAVCSVVALRRGRAQSH